MAKRKQKIDQIMGENAHLGEQLDTNIITSNKDHLGIPVETITQEELAAEVSAQPDTKTIHISPDESVESLTSHHLKRGTRAGEVNEAEVRTHMEMLIAGDIHFTGAYHDKRRKEFYDHLAGHYNEIGVEPPEYK